MPPLNIEQIRTHRIRGYILNLLDQERPNPLEAEAIRIVLDGMNYCDTQQELSAHIDYLRSEGLIYCFRPTDDELKRPDAARLVQSYSRGHANEMLCKLTAKGVRWIEGADSSDVAVARV